MLIFTSGENSDDSIVEDSAERLKEEIDFMDQDEIEQIQDLN